MSRDPKDDNQNPSARARAFLGWITGCLAVVVVAACAAFGGGSGGGVDLGRLADEVALVRQDVADLAALASPETQARLGELDKAVHQVEDALRAAGAGGPVHDVTSAANAALSVADLVLASMPPEDAGDLRLYVGLARIALRHVAAAKFGEAEQALEEAAGPAK